MKTLVLCIDRDDDIGVKTGIKGPIVGREDNVRAANRLGLADPEDADLNTLYSSLQTYDGLAKKGKNVEIATICGDKNVGHESDRILTEQLDEVLEEMRPDHVYLITDGAEDEYIFPIISSRIKVNHVKRVFVKQSPTLESTFYVLVRTLKDERMRRKILMPFILVLLPLGIIGFLVPFLTGLAVFGPDFLANIPNYALSLIAFALGLYLLYLAFPLSFSASRLYKRITTFYENAKKSITGGDLSLIFTVIGLILVVIGIFMGLDAAFKEARSMVNGVLFFIGGALLWVILGVLTHEGGKVARAYQKGIRIKPSFWVVTITLFVALIVFSLLALVAFNLVELILNLKSPETVLILTFFEIGISLIVIIAGSILYRNMQEKAAKEDAWRR
jgi:putative membrane protein